jgi:hypothetical protein
MRQSGMSRRRIPGWLCIVMLGLALYSAQAPAASAPEFSVDGVKITVDFADADFANGTEPLAAWIKRSSGIVAAYYGHFPVSQLSIRVSSSLGGGVHHGTTFGEPRPFIRISVGRDVTPAELLNDWVLVHEMTHLALPDVGDEHAWLSEGIAVYVEGVARAQAGNRPVADVWAEDMRSMPRGLPQIGDAGLDHTHTWGRTYWGGALFCLLADIEIRQRTDNHSGLQTALRAIARQSGGLVSSWPIERVLAVGDAAVGTHVLEDLYAKSKDSAQPTDLAALWRSLGIEPASDGGVELREDAPLARIRDTIMRAPVDSRRANDESAS